MMRKWTKRLFTLLLCVVFILVGIRFGPLLLKRIYGGANATWISERFTEELTTKRTLVVLEKTITGQENISTDAWLIGTVQEVVIPYSFTASFSVDLSLAEVQYDAENGAIQVLLPPPVVSYYKLAVDENSVEKYDFLYPLSSDRYTEMKLEMEQRLYDEVINDPELKESAWASAVSETEALYQAVIVQNDAAGILSVVVLEADPESLE